MFSTKCQVVSTIEYDDIFEQETLIAEFATPAEEVAYETRDSVLIDLIRREVRCCFGENEEQLHAGEDWWPNHTRYIEATPAHCTADFLTAIQNLLIDDFINYRIQICVYERPSSGETYIGSMNLYHDRVIIERDLYNLLQKQIDL